MRGVECKGTRVENLSPPLDDRSRPCTLMGAEGLARIICIDSLNSHDNLKFMFMRSLRLPKSGVETFFKIPLSPSSFAYFAFARVIRSDFLSRQDAKHAK